MGRNIFNVECQRRSEESRERTENGKNEEPEKGVLHRPDFPTKIAKKNHLHQGQKEEMEVEAHATTLLKSRSMVCEG